MFLDKNYIVFVQVLIDLLLIYVLKVVIFDELEYDQDFMNKMLVGMVKCIYDLMVDVEFYLLQLVKQ